MILSEAFSGIEGKAWLASLQNPMQFLNKLLDTCDQLEMLCHDSPTVREAQFSAREWSPKSSFFKVRSTTDVKAPASPSESDSYAPSTFTDYEARGKSVCAVTRWMPCRRSKEGTQISDSKLWKFETALCTCQDASRHSSWRLPSWRDKLTQRQKTDRSKRDSRRSVHVQGGPCHAHHLHHQLGFAIAVAISPEAVL